MVHNGDNWEKNYVKKRQYIFREKQKEKNQNETGTAEVWSVSLPSVKRLTCIINCY